MKRFNLTTLALLLFALWPMAVLAVEEGGEASGDSFVGISNLIIIVGLAAILFVGLAMAGRTRSNDS
jgi:hypothetical protein